MTNELSRMHRDELLVLAARAEDNEKPASVVIKFKSSSQPKGQDGYELAVSSDATEADVDRTMLLAARAREQAQDVLAGEYTGSRVHEGAEPERRTWEDQIEEARRMAADDANREAKVDGAEVGYVGYV